MLQIRPCRSEELPIVVQRCAESALEQLVARELPGATREGVAARVRYMYQNALAVPRSTLLVAEWPPGLPADPPAGHALLMPQPNGFTGEEEVVVMDIFTHPALRGHGVGRNLLRQAAAYARAIGCSQLAAQVVLHNQASLNLFRGAGFGDERLVLGLRLQP